MPNTHQPHSTLIDYLKELPDPRVNRTRYHELTDILVISICTLLCGGESFYDMEDFGKAKQDWFATFLPLPNGIPSHDTFTRVFSILDPASFQECFIRWTQSLREAIDREIVAIDGKALRHAREAGGDVRYIVNAWAGANRLILGQLKVPDKTNEITAVPTLLRALELTGCIVTTDAMGCQKKIAREMIEADADHPNALQAFPFVEIGEPVQIDALKVATDFESSLAFVDGFYRSKGDGWIGVACHSRRRGCGMAGKWLETRRRSVHRKPPSVRRANGLDSMHGGGEDGRLQAA